MYETCKVIVVSAVMKTFWYAKYIGKIFEVKKSKTIGREKDLYYQKDWYYAERYELVLDGETLKSFIRHEDCEKVD